MENRTDFILHELRRKGLPVSRNCGTDYDHAVALFDKNAQEYEGNPNIMGIFLYDRAGFCIRWLTHIGAN